MELVAIYLYNRIPIETDNILNITFHGLKRDGWYTDARTNRKFTMLNKRIEYNGQWYRAMIRFEYKGIDPNGQERYQLSIPTPFLITECEPLESVTSARWKDSKTYHGPKLGSVAEMMKQGVPSEIIDEVYKDLLEHTEY